MTSELDPQARALIGLALQGERRLPRGRERVRRGVLAAVVAPAVGLSDAALAAGKVAGVAGSAGVGSKATLLGAATWLKLAPVALVSVAAGVAGVQQFRSAEAGEPVRWPAVSAAAAPAAAPVVQPLLPSLSPLEVPTMLAEPTPAPRAPVKPQRPSSAPVEESEPAASAPPSLAGELDALQRAQRALNAGNAAGALRELGAISGQALRAERTALEVFAHCALGNLARARQQAALFRQLAPRSPLLPRVDASCAGE